LSKSSLYQAPPPLQSCRHHPGARERVGPLTLPTARSTSTRPDCLACAVRADRLSVTPQSARGCRAGCDSACPPCAGRSRLEAWLVDMEAGTSVVDKSVNHFIDRKRTARVSSIFVFASDARSFPNQKTARTFMVKEFRNRYCQQGSGIVIPDFSRGVESWRNLEDFARRLLGDCTFRDFLYFQPQGLITRREPVLRGRWR
jgi:hypothetical protein